MIEKIINNQIFKLVGGAALIYPDFPVNYHNLLYEYVATRVHYE